MGLGRKLLGHSHGHPDGHSGRLIRRARLYEYRAAIGLRGRRRRVLRRPGRAKRRPTWRPDPRQRVRHRPLHGDGTWLVVAPSAGSTRNPSWHHNIAAHPDQVWIEVAGRQLRVTAEQLEGERRDEAWQRIIASQPRYAGYQRKTDRVLPIIRLSPAHDPDPPPTTPH